MRNLLLLFLSISLLLSCKQTTQPANSPNKVTVETPEGEPVENKVATTVENVGGMLGTDQMFPYVYVESINKLRFEAYTMKFTLEHPNTLIPLNNTDTPWINAENYSESNGQFITYIRNGRDLSLENPYIMAQYINKNLPFCGTVDSVYQWLDQRFINEQIKGEVITDVYEMKTQSGKPAICKEYRTPKTPDGRAAKRMAYAYVDFNDTYIIGMNMTALSESDFEVSKPDFYQLVKTFALP